MCKVGFARIPMNFTIFAGMSAVKTRRKKIVRNLRSIFRLVVLNDQTLEEKFSLRLTPMNIIIFGGTFALSLITITLYLIAFTPLREYIPGYTDVTIRRNLLSVALKTDSLDRKMEAQEAYLNNLLNVLNEKADTTKPLKQPQLLRSTIVSANSKNQRKMPCFVSRWKPVISLN
jgi:hypothetical protein